MKNVLAGIRLGAESSAQPQITRGNNKDFKGMMTGVSDAHNLKDKDWDKINDWEMFAGMASFTMGKFKDGERKLPEFMRRFFSPIFTSNVSVKPYYEK